MKILVVDDEEMIRNVIEEYLKKWGYSYIEQPWLMSIDKSKI